MFYKIKLNSILILGCLFTLCTFFIACSNDDDVVQDPIGEEDDMDDPDDMDEPENRTTGFVIVGLTASGAVAQYFEEIPTGTVDLSGGTDFATFIVRSVFDGAIFTPRIDGTSGYSKLVVNAEGQIVEDATIATPSRGRIVVRDDEIGVFQNDLDPLTISVFNPTTFEVTGTIDMSGATIPDGVDIRYNKFIFRGDDVFMDIRDNAASSNPYFTDYIVHQANLSTNSFVGDTQRDGNGSGGTIRNAARFGQRLTDAAGNLYMPDEGNFEGFGISARVNRIPAGSNEIDPTYTFEPAATLNPQNAFLPYYDHFTILESGRAVAVVYNEVPQEAIDLVTSAGGLANLTPEQLQQLAQIVFTTDGTGAWCELDLEAMTVTPINGIPALSPFAVGSVQIFEYEGEAYIPVINSDENAYYRLDASSSNASRAFGVTGFDASSVYNIGNNN